jgi:uncharacterized protein
LLVGFCEEITYRGLLLTSLRSKLSDGWVCILTSVIFGLIHGSHIMLGQDISTTISQFFFAALMGFSLYMVRRVTGSLIWAMLLHGLWDVSVFMSNYASTVSNGLEGLSLMFAAPLSIIFLFIVFRKIKKAEAN